ncbi:MAG: tRNA (adenosine(37)-N6)-threonylcarbamoyltransferase complex transferase subunit TsaD [Planctomycetota bacterium]
MTLILGLETSCDETAAAVVDERLAVRSNVVATQFDLHERYAGVVPEIASRAHLEKLTPVVTEALAQAGVTPRDLSAIAVGHRPGLVGSLIVGVAAAKALAWSLDLPLVGVDHVEAHLSAASLRGPGCEDPKSGAQNTNPIPIPEPRVLYPALGLVVSGGHTSLYRIHAPRQLERLGGTIDDAIGEAFDKAAVILGLGYPGGPRIDALARRGDPQRFALPRPTLDKHSLDFSFSGLKTALLYAVRGHPVGRGKDAAFQRDHTDHDEQTLADFAAGFQAAAVDTVTEKLRRALHLTQESHGVSPWAKPPRSLILGGGVSANSLLRKRVQEFADHHQLACHLPAMDFCVDNAAMIAGHAHALLADGDTHGLDLPVVATTRA